ncbi:MAG: hypothetical protein ACR2QA_04110 [Solirubrobacteraceae bacterium]
MLCNARRGGSASSGTLLTISGNFLYIIKKVSFFDLVYIINKVITFPLSACTLERRVQCIQRFHIA